MDYSVFSSATGIFPRAQIPPVSSTEPETSSRSRSNSFRTIMEAFERRHEAPPPSYHSVVKTVSVHTQTDSISEVPRIPRFPPPVSSSSTSTPVVVPRRTRSKTKTDRQRLVQGVRNLAIIFFVFCFFTYGFNFSLHQNIRTIVLATFVTYSIVYTFM